MRKRLPGAIGLALVAALLSMAAAGAGQTGTAAAGGPDAATLASLPVALSDADKARLAGFAAAREQGLKEARAAGSPDDLAELDKVLAGVATPATDKDLAGKWRCRTIKLGGEFGALTIYGYFPCRIAMKGGRLMFEKPTGSQRKAGELYRLGDDSLLLVAVGYYDDEQPFAYGSKPDRDEVGILYRTGPKRLRVEFPSPHYESRFDIIDMVK